MTAKTEPITEPENENERQIAMAGEISMSNGGEGSTILPKQDNEPGSPVDTSLDNSISDKRLKYFNIGAGTLHFIQGMLMLVASQAVDNIKKQGARKVTLRFLSCIKNETTDRCAEPVRLSVQENDIGTLEIGAAAASFLLLSALAHLLVVIFFKKYIADINKGINVFRWYEYALSSSVMIVAIAALFGMQDLASIILMFLVNCSMNLFGLLMERMNVGTNKKYVNWEPFIFAWVAGIAPWIAVALYFFSGPLDQIPGFVYGIVFSYFCFFQSFPVNMFLQYKKIGAWKNYRVGEVGYQILSLLSKSLLAWLVFGGTFQPTNE